MTIDPDLHAFATGTNFAALTTLSAHGQPSTQMMWIDADDENLIINTEIHRQKFKNMSADPRVCVTVIDSQSPYRYIEARGHVVAFIHGLEAREHIDTTAIRYTGKPYAPPITSERVIVKVAVDRIHRNNI